MKRFVGCLLGLGLAACASDGTSDQTVWTPVDESVVGAATSKTGHPQLTSVIDDHWALMMRESPTFATSLGVRDYDDRLSDPSLEAYAEGISARRTLLARLKKIDRSDLTEDEALNRQLLMLELENEIEASKYGGRYMIMTNRGGPHLNLTGLPDYLPFRSEADYESYLTRLTLMPEYLEKSTDRLRSGLEAGWVQPCAPMAGYEDSINIHIVIDPADSTFMRPFDNKPASIDEARFAAMRVDAARTIRDQIVPAFREFEAFYNLEYQPACREDVGTISMPGGKEYYEYRVRLFTTLDLTPEDVHQTGLAEVARIRAEMEEIAKGEGFESLSAFQTYLRSNPDFYPKTAEERLERAAWISKKMDGQLVKLFTKIPRMPYDIKEIPLDIAEKTTTAYYFPPAGDGSRAGSYYVNTTLLDTRPLHELEALTLHEAVPGHHFQIALAQELDMPAFRRFGGFTAFVEGWGLYSERLGMEVGFYETPYTDFGRLSYEMWRATRLVVDTGMHYKGWSRQRAIDYMLDNSGLSRNNVTTEVDRYITWPGQALAYKTGELKIRELRARAEAELGKDFDVRLFHDAVLEAGAVPLSVLEERIEKWIAKQKAG
ncbi:DUF885 family protein [Parvularcula marina]|uniref:DUF885 domain-containing protein n=1 Tax=Parvularcula marina TaxID=2292771 RepID=UPI003512DB33